jgi:hypothetical protein
VDEIYYTIAASTPYPLRSASLRILIVLLSFSKSREGIVFWEVVILEAKVIRSTYIQWLIMIRLDVHNSDT